MKIRDVLQLKDEKHRTAITIGPKETVLAAIHKLVEWDRGALSVCDDAGRLLGIVTERDVVRKCLANGGSCANITVDSIMTRKVAIGTLDDDTDYAINVMKEKVVRHIPILDGERVVGMISMRDLLGLELAECKAQTRYVHILPKGVHS